MPAAELDGKAVPLIGGAQDLRYLSEHFRFGDFGIYRVESNRRNPTTNEDEEYDEYYLKSSSFDLKEDDWEIYGDAVDILELVNGEAQLETRLFNIVNGKVRGGPELEPIQASRGVDEFKAGRKTNVGVLGGAVTATLLPSDFRKMLKAQGLEIPEDIKQLDDAGPMEAVIKQEKMIETRFPLLELAESDPNVREALVYFGYRHSWASLYRVWDVIKKDTKYHSQRFNNPDFRELVKGTAIDGNESRFARTADYHRHGGPGREKILPKIPMNLDEAERFVRILMLYWVSWKYDSSSIS
ncbi:MAG: hypothetical protein WBZ42_08545 [Halobacteriota archaeon]